MLDLIVLLKHLLDERLKSGENGVVTGDFSIEVECHLCYEVLLVVAN